MHGFPDAHSLRLNSKSCNYSKIFVIAHWDLSQWEYFLFNLWNKKSYLKYMLQVENKISNGV